MTGHEHSGGTVATLKSIVLYEGLLDGTKLAVLGQPFHGSDLFTVGLDGKEKTRLDHSTVQKNRASTAFSHHASHMGAGQPNAKS